MIDVKEAVDIILKNVQPKDIYEEIYISDSTDRICFDDVTCDMDIPTFTRSAMDGYALVFGQDKHRYKIVENKEDLKENRCIRINTGFPIPKIADAVAEVEKTVKNGEYIIIEDIVQKERNFTKSGTELKKGSSLIKKGEKISVRKMALLAYAGVVSIKVYQKPIVGIITTGDEVVFPSCNLPENSVFNSNFFIVDGLAKKWGANTIYFGHINDEKTAFRERMLYALDRCDVLLTTGGVSKGTKDYTKDVLRDIGANVLFERTVIKPGKPAAFAAYKDKYIFSLPGWPAALYTTAYVYLKPFLMKSAGMSRYDNIFLSGILNEDMHSQKDKDYFNRVKVEYKKGEFYLNSAGSQKTDNYYSIANSDGLVWLDTKKENVKKGSELPFLFFED